MLILYNGVDSLTFPNGVAYTANELKSMDEYKHLFNGNYVLENVDGVTFSYQPLSNYIIAYGIEETGTAEEVFSKVLVAIQKETENRAIKVSMSSIKKVAQFLSTNLTDEQAVEVSDLYPEFEIGHDYKIGDRFQYNNSLFKVNQNHTSQAQWVPGDEGTEALYTNLMLDESGYLIWKQPTGAHDAYNTGDVVRYPDANGQLYKSTIDGNVWAPDAYPQGWEVYTEE